ncbi:protein CcmA, bactofilin family [Muriicola jejuensis]|uniref:Polymer-forming cytoskeletal protein n=1 Tax=Muriicola jejuensis TaxID=504488 RepID=A0A6P0U9H9_9FLAO|nr:polymer-forming cytoskeletal protein [Muriicola jejuensis]NER09885.1 polymer-forming cytoskeletal protein [Muriicola jejuensis]SMP05064.1 protein CcmA, bactofilin family [Muriicola jejuensis]
MFSDNKKPKAMTETGGQPNRIEKHTKIKGDIVSEADFRIDGKLNGNLKTSGKVVIGKDGYINGKVECLNADIEGNFNGELLVSELLTLKSSALIEGTVTVAKLAVEPGATFNASCSMKGKGGVNTTAGTESGGTSTSAFKATAVQSKNEPAKAS